MKETPDYLNSNSTDSKLTFSATKPDVGDLQQDLEDCVPIANGWNRILDNECIRYARWFPQWSDNRKYDTDQQKALPWNAASDVRIMMADAVCSELAEILVVALENAIINASGTNDLKSQERAQNWQKILDWYVRNNKTEFRREAELSAQYLVTYGLAILNPKWERDVQQELKKLTMDQLAQAGQGAMPGSPIQMLPLLIQDPEQEEAAVETLELVGDMLVKQLFQSQLGDAAEDLMADFKLSKKRIKKLVRSLREEGVGEIPLPYFCKNQPVATALKPYHDVFFKTGMVDVQKSRIHVREFVTEVELRNRINSDNYDADWVEEAIKRKGEWIEWQQDSLNNSTFGPRTLDTNWTMITRMEEGRDLIEIFWSYYWQIDPDDGVKTLTLTVWQADSGGGKANPMERSYGWSGPADFPHRKSPFVAGVMEWIDRCYTLSRGVPERMAPLQQEVKMHRDGLINQQQVSLVPPVNVYETGLSTRINVGPLAQNFCKPGKEPKPWDIRPVGADIALEMWDRAGKETRNMWGLLDVDVPAARSQTKMQKIINNYLGMWTEAFKMMFALIEKYTPDNEYLTITGEEKPKLSSNDILKQYDLDLKLDAKSMDMDMIQKQLEVIAQMIKPLDTANTIPNDILVPALVRSWNPSLARELVAPPQAGVQQVQKKVQDNVMKMMDGFQPDLGVDADPTAQMQKQMLEQMAQTNPKIMESMEKDPKFRESMMEYVKNLEFNIQQNQNKAVGRTGVQQGNQ